MTPVSIDHPQPSAPNGAQRLERSADSSVLPPCQHRALLAELTHDLKNPLAVIRAGTQLLDRCLSRPVPIGPAAVRDGLAQIGAASARLALLLGDLLDVVSSGAENPPAAPSSPMDLVGLARQVADRYQAATERHVLRVETGAAAVIGRWNPTSSSASWPTCCRTRSSTAPTAATS